MPCDAFAEVVDVPPVRGILMGGMAVANLELYCMDCAHQEGWAFAIANGQVTQNSLNPRYLQLDHLYSEIDFEYVDTLFTDSIETLEEALDEMRPEVIIMDALGEDLATLGANDTPMAVSQRVFDYAWWANNSYGVPVITTMSAIRKANGINCTVDDYNARVAIGNYHMRFLVNHTPFLAYHKTKGFARMEDGSTMPIQYYSADGISPGPAVGSYGFEQYKRQVRSAFLNAIPRVAVAPPPQH